MKIKAINRSEMRIGVENKSLYNEMVKASSLVYGTGNDDIMGDDYGAARECLNIAYEMGFNVFDTANAYGNAEVNLGKWLQETGNRNNIIILDKGCNPGQAGSKDIMSAELIRNQCELSLQRLQTEKVELYVLHRDEEVYPYEKVIEELNKLVDEGKIMRFGASNWSFERIKKANEYAKLHNLKGFEAVSPAYSLAILKGDPWGRSITLSGEGQKEYRKWCQENQIPVFSYSSLARGYMSGKYKTYEPESINYLWGPTRIEYDYSVNMKRLQKAEELARVKGVTVGQIALAWLLHQPLNIYPIVGPSKKAHMEDVIGALDISLTKEEIKELEVPDNE